MLALRRPASLLSNIFFFLRGFFCFFFRGGGGGKCFFLLLLLLFLGGLFLADDFCLYIKGCLFCFFFKRMICLFWVFSG